MTKNCEKQHECTEVAHVLQIIVLCEKLLAKKDQLCKLHSVKSVDKTKHVTNKLRWHVAVAGTEHIPVPELTRQLNFQNFFECCFSISNSVENYKSFSTAVLESKNQSVGFTM